MSVTALDTGSRTFVGNAVAVEPVTFGYYPTEGSRIAAAQYSWATLTGYAEDLSRLVSLGMETTAQSVYIDNSLNPQSVTFAVPTTGQVIIVPAGRQGIFPLLFTGLPFFNISTPAAVAGGVTRICVLNVPAGDSLWPCNAGGLGTDHSANAPAVPIAGTVLLATVNPNPLRANITVQNLSAGLVQIVRDDGNGNNITTILLVASAAAPGAGGIWNSPYFNGRIRVYGTAGSAVSVSED